MPAGANQTLRAWLAEDRHVAIDARTPEETAISVLAELIAGRAGRAGAAA